MANRVKSQYMRASLQSKLLNSSMNQGNVILEKWNKKCAFFFSTHPSVSICNSEWCRFYYTFLLWQKPVRIRWYISKCSSNSSQSDLEHKLLHWSGHWRSALRVILCIPSMSRKTWLALVTNFDLGIISKITHLLTWTHLTLVSLMTSFPTITTKFQLQFYLLHYLGCDKHVSVLKTNYNYVTVRPWCFQTKPKVPWTILLLGPLYTMYFLTDSKLLYIQKPQKQESPWTF